MSVLVGVEKDLSRMPEHLRDGGLASVARAMAERIDSGSKCSPSECGRVIVECLVQLRDLAPEEVVLDVVDDLAAARKRRRGAAS